MFKQHVWKLLWYQSNLGQRSIFDSTLDFTWGKAICNVNRRDKQSIEFSHMEGWLKKLKKRVQICIHDFKGITYKQMQVWYVEWEWNLMAIDLVTHDSLISSTVRFVTFWMYSSTDVFASCSKWNSCLFLFITTPLRPTLISAIVDMLGRIHQQLLEIH